MSTSRRSKKNIVVYDDNVESEPKSTRKSRKTAAPRRGIGANNARPKAAKNAATKATLKKASAKKSTLKKPSMKKPSTKKAAPKKASVKKASVKRASAKSPANAIKQPAATYVSNVDNDAPATAAQLQSSDDLAELQRLESSDSDDPVSIRLALRRLFAHAHSHLDRVVLHNISHLGRAHSLAERRNIEHRLFAHAHSFNGLTIEHFVPLVHLTTVLLIAHFISQSPLVPLFL
jgi:hypothetical protein